MTMDFAFIAINPKDNAPINIKPMANLGLLISIMSDLSYNENVSGFSIFSFFKYYDSLLKMHYLYF